MLTILLGLAIVQAGGLIALAVIVWCDLRPVVRALHTQHAALHVRASEIRETQDRILFPHGRVK